MKTILVPTDFSEPARDAALYAVHLANVIGAKVTICHALKVPMESPMAAQVAWPLEDYDTLKTEGANELNHLATTLRYEVKESGMSNIYTCSSVGEVTDVIRNTVDDQKHLLVVMGMSGAGAISRFFFLSNTEELISKANFPVLLIPAKTQFKPIKKIAFATDLNPGDIALIHVTAGLALHFNAELLIAHITNENYDHAENKKDIDSFLNDVTCKANYPAIYYRHIKNANVNDGLKWLCENALVDMLVMVHRRVSTLGQVFDSSYTKKSAHHIKLPLLVLPAGLPSVRF